MELSPDSITRPHRDAILVKVLDRPDQIGRFYVPASVRDKHNRKSAWKAEVLQLGPKVDQADFKHATVGPGAVVYVDPQALDCPGFDGPDRSGHFKFVRPEDLLAIEEADL